MPRPLRPFLLVFATAMCVSLALLGQANQPTGAKLAAAATAFVNSLPDDLKRQATFDLDDPHRTTWYFTPQQTQDRKPTRKGVRLEALTADQKAAALELLKAGLSAKGYTQATTIMSLEGILLDLEGANGAMVRNPGWYFVSIFGTPNNTGRWGWRVEGHHLSINMTLDKGEVVASTPVMFGANPAEVKSGAKKGLRTLPEIEDLARAVIGSLDPTQTTTAKQAKQLSEIQEKVPTAGVGDPVGLAVSAMTDAQKSATWKLLEAYAERLPADAAAVELKRVQSAGWDKVKFAFAGDPTAGRPWTYRLHGPTFVVEFLNVQADGAKNPNNHIHSAWRRLPADFAKD